MTSESFDSSRLIDKIVLMNNTLFLLAAVFLAVFTQSVSGFGVALVAMSLLPAIVGIHTATPLVALIAIVLELFLFLRYRSAFNFQAIWRITLASLIGIPIGLYAFKQVNPEIIVTLLGIILVAYAVYGLIQLKLPEFKHPYWAYLMGFIAGIIGGAYNTSGPPVIIYGNCRRWLPNEFKGNLQGYFLVTTVVIILGHLISGNLTIDVWKYFLGAAPAIILGVIAGVSLDKVINPELFRKIVLVLLLIMGVNLVIGQL